MQHAAWTFDTSDIPWILQNLLFSQTSFNWPRSPLIFANSCPGWPVEQSWRVFEIISHSWLLNFIETRRASFNTSDITNWNYSTWSVMPKPVSLLTVQEAHKEYSSLTDQIRAKYEQLDSGEFGSPGTPAFDAKACELATLLARVSQLCQRLSLPMPKELYRPTFFKHWRHFLDQNLHRQAVLVRVWRMQLCSHRYVRITGLLSAL